VLTGLQLLNQLLLAFLVNKVHAIGFQFLLLEETRWNVYQQVHQGIADTIDV
jgi:hypothetical protein